MPANARKNVVVNKADGKLEETIQSTPAATQQAVKAIAPGTWTETYTMPNMTCEINAEIVLPGTSKFPVLKVKKRVFDGPGQ